MHAKGITNKKGIALERVSFEIPTNEDGNWLSASGQSGYGTPGYENSQNSMNSDPEIFNRNSITVEYPSTDNGEYGIRYQLDKSGYNCRLLIYDSSGRTIGTIAGNEILGSHGVIYWNGKGDSNRKLLPGIYVIYLEIFDVQGNVHTFKTPVVVK
jgi:hypothetical protein